MKREYTTNSAKETKALGMKLASEKYRVLALRGDLGGGKTTFLQGFAKGLGIKEKILSPTFVIMKKFEIPSQTINTSNYQNFYHIDCYRIKNAKDIQELGLKEIFSNPKNIVAIEWAERVENVLPKETQYLDFEFLGENKRKIWFDK